MFGVSWRLVIRMRSAVQKVARHRDTEYAKAYIATDRPKKENAELAITNVRQMEADSYGRMQKWRNELVTMTETLHALRLKMKVHFAEGSIGNIHNK
jgi:hypothetical protein